MIIIYEGNIFLNKKATDDSIEYFGDEYFATEKVCTSNSINNQSNSNDNKNDGKFGTLHSKNYIYMAIDTFCPHCLNIQQAKKKDKNVYNCTLYM